jgi:hypothetical protein
MLAQKGLRLTVTRLPGESQRSQGYRQAEIDGKFEKVHVPREKLFADLLKRQARAAMAGVTECPPVALPHALAALESVKETILFAQRHELIPGAETVRSDAQLANAHTLADLLACMEITRREHRAPVFLNSRDTELAKLRHDFSQLAGLVCLALPHAKMPDCFCVEESEVVL